MKKLFWNLFLFISLIYLSSCSSITNTPSETPVGALTTTVTGSSAMPPTSTPIPSSTKQETPKPQVSNTFTETATPILTLTLVPSVTPTQVRLSVGDSGVAKAAYEGGSILYVADYVSWDKKDETPETGVILNTGLVSLNIYGPMLFHVEWCASTAKILKDNAESVQFSLSIDNQEITPDKYFSTSYTSNNQKECQISMIMIDQWNYGEFTLSRTITFKTDITDGEVKMPAGKRTDTFTVIVKTAEQLKSEMDSCYSSIGDNPFYSLTSYMPRYCDSFITNQGWVTGDYSDDFLSESWKISDGKLSGQVTAKSGFIKPIFIPIQDNMFSDFAISLEGRKTEGTRNSAYGIIFRRDASTDSYYYFYILDSKPTYGVDLYYKGKWITLKEITISDVINLNGWNQLTIIAKGPQFDCQINGKSVFSFDDDRLPKGEIWFALELKRPNESVSFEFDNFIVVAP